MPKPVTIRTADYIRALTLAEKFNQKAGARPNRKVAAVLKDAIGFLQGVAPDVKAGQAIETGSAWHGPDEFLSATTAREMGRKRDRSDYLTGARDVQLSQRDAAALSDIRKTFGLKSDRQAAGLALRVYAGVADGLSRGNGFSFSGPQAPALDTVKVKDKLFPPVP